MSHDNPVTPAETFEAFLAGMSPQLKRHLALYHIPVADAEDVLHQALLALLCRWDSIRDPERWLLGTLSRHCLMYWRTRRRRLYSAVDGAILEWLAGPQAPAQERCDLLADLRHMVGRLPPRCRTLLELRFQLGYDAGEAARHLGYRGSSMAKVTNRCLAALTREMLQAASPGAPAAAGAMKVRTRRRTPAAEAVAPEPLPPLRQRRR